MQRSVLIIEDNHVAQLVAMHLRDEGYDVEIAADGTEGLAAAERGG